MKGAIVVHTPLVQGRPFQTNRDHCTHVAICDYNSISRIQFKLWQTHRALFRSYVATHSSPVGIITLRCIRPTLPIAMGSTAADIHGGGRESKGRVTGPAESTLGRGTGCWRRPEQGF